MATPIQLSSTQLAAFKSFIAANFPDMADAFRFTKNSVLVPDEAVPLLAQALPTLPTMEKLTHATAGKAATPAVATKVWDGLVSKFRVAADIPVVGTGSPLSASKPAEVVARQAAAARNVAQIADFPALANLAPDELANPLVRQSLARRGLIPQGLADDAALSADVRGRAMQFFRAKTPTQISAAFGESGLPGTAASRMANAGSMVNNAVADAFSGAASPNFNMVPPNFSMLNGTPPLPPSTPPVVTGMPEPLPPVPSATPAPVNQFLTTGLSDAPFGPALTRTVLSKEAESALGKLTGTSGGRIAQFLSRTPFNSKVGNNAISSAAERAMVAGLPESEVLAAARGAASSGPAWLRAGSIGRGGAYAAGGLLASNIIRGLYGGEADGSIDNMLEGAAQWGGAGAGVGSMILPGWGTAIGGALGAVGGGLYGLFTGQDSPTTQRDDYLKLMASDADGTLYSQLRATGLSPQSTTQAIAQLRALAATAPDKKSAQAVVAQFLPNMLQLAGQEKLYTDAQAQRAANSQYFTSTLMPSYMSSLDQMTTDAKSLTAARLAAAQQVTDPTIRAMYTANAQSTPLAVDQLRASYLGQLTALGGMYQSPTNSFYPSIFGSPALSTQTNAAATADPYASVVLGLGQQPQQPMSVLG